MNILLDVSGKIFEVNKDIICGSQLFKTMLNDYDLIEKKIVLVPIRIDRSRKLFKHIYAYLIDREYPFPKKYYKELDYYLIEYDINKLYDSNTIILNKISLLQNDICNLSCKINDIKNHINIPEEKACPYLGCSEMCLIKPKPTCSNHEGICCYYYQCWGRNYTNEYCYNKTDPGKAYCIDHKNYED